MSASAEIPTDVSHVAPRGEAGQSPAARRPGPAARGVQPIEERLERGAVGDDVREGPGASRTRWHPPYGARAAVIGLAALLWVTACAPRTALAEPLGSADAVRALALCRQAEDAPETARRDVLRQGIALAESAVAADANDAAAHFALFCNLGREAQLAGIGLGSLSTVRRLGREIDATLELAPVDPDALVAKAAFLLHLPRWLGGDPAAAERLLRAALAADPQHGPARTFLAEALAAGDLRRALVVAH